MKKLILEDMQPVTKLVLEDKIMITMRKNKKPLSYTTICVKTGCSSGGSTSAALRRLIYKGLLKKGMCVCGETPIYKLT